MVVTIYLPLMMKAYIVLLFMLSVLKCKIVSPIPLQKGARIQIGKTPGGGFYLSNAVYFSKLGLDTLDLTASI